MSKFTFTIKGNQESNVGNPLAYFRTTQGSRWNAGSKKYDAWKQFVKGCFLSELMDKKKITGADFKALVYVHPNMKPIQKSKLKMRMDLQIYWCSDAHADPDNVFKGIADALFENDKYLAGSFDFTQAIDKKGKVDVTITLSE